MKVDLSVKAVLNVKITFLAYKNKECQVALENYNEAAKLDPHDATFLANKAAVYVELAKYEDAAACCRIALKLAHEYGCTRALFAKLYSRLGNCEKGQKKWKDAIKLYNTSLVIENNPNVLKLRNLSVKVNLRSNLVNSTTFI